LVLTQAAWRDRSFRAGDAASPEAAEQLRVLRAGRRILQRTPDTTVTLALNRAAGRGNSQLVLLALNRLDAVTLKAYQASFFDFEERPTTHAAQLLRVIDDAIADLEASHDRRVATHPRRMALTG
jgi:hypothetical protein